MHKPNIQSSNREPFKRYFESIHLVTWTKDDSYNSIVVNVEDGETLSSLSIYNVVVRKLTYEEKDLKGKMVNIYQKPQALINYLIDTFSNEGDWVLDLFSSSGKNYDLIFMKSYFNLRLFFNFCLFIVSNFIIYFIFGDYVQH